MNSLLFGLECDPFLIFALTHDANIPLIWFVSRMSSFDVVLNSFHNFIRNGIRIVLLFYLGNHSESSLQINFVWHPREGGEDNDRKTRRRKEMGIQDF